MLAAAVGGVLAPGAASASAATRAHHRVASTEEGCASATFCLYSGLSFSGTRFDYSYSGHSHDTWLYVGSGANDQAASLLNNRAWTTKVGQNFPESGGYACWAGQGHTPALNAFTYSNNGTLQYHTISSFDLKTSSVSSCTGGA